MEVNQSKAAVQWNENTGMISRITLSMLLWRGFHSLHVDTKRTWDSLGGPGLSHPQTSGVLLLAHLSPPLTSHPPTLSRTPFQYATIDNWKTSQWVVAETILKCIHWRLPSGTCLVRQLFNCSISNSIVRNVGVNKPLWKTNFVWTF